MAVHEQHPSTAVLAALDERLRFGSLSLAEGDVVDLLAHATQLGVLDQALDRIGAAHQDEDERQAHRRVAEGGGQVKGRRLDESPPEHRLDVELDGGHTLIGAQGAQHEHPAHHVALGLPGRGELVELRIDRVIHLAPRFEVGRDVVVDAAEGRQLRQVDELEPHAGGEPVGVGLLAQVV